MYRVSSLPRYTDTPTVCTHLCFTFSTSQTPISSENWRYRSTSCFTKLVNFTHLRSVKFSCDLSLRTQLWFLVLRSTKERPTQQRVSCRTLRFVPYDPTQGVTQSSTSRRSGPSYRRRVWSEGLSYSASDLLSLALSYANKAAYCGLVTPSISSILIYLVTVSYVSR